MMVYIRDIRELAEKWALPLPETAWNIGSPWSKSHRSVYFSSRQWKHSSLSNFFYIIPHHIPLSYGLRNMKSLEKLSPCLYPEPRCLGRPLRLAGHGKERETQEDTQQPGRHLIWGNKSAWERRAETFIRGTLLYSVIRLIVSSLPWPVHVIICQRVHRWSNYIQTLSNSATQWFQI